MARHRSALKKPRKDRASIDELSQHINMQLLKAMEKTGVSKSQICERLSISMDELNRRLVGEDKVKLRELADMFTAMGCEIHLRLLDARKGIYWLNFHGKKQAGSAMVAANSQREAEDHLAKCLEKDKVEVEIYPGDGIKFKPRLDDCVQYFGPLPKVIKCVFLMSRESQT